MKSTTKIALSAFVLAFSTFSHAGTITAGSAVASNPSQTVTFERSGNLPYSEAITNQFATQGVTFSVNSGESSLFNTKGCNPDGLTGWGYVAIGVTPNCGVSNSMDNVSLAFSQNVAELSFTYVTNNGASYLFEALQDGNVVSSIVTTFSSPSNTTYLFAGSTFDTLRFSSNNNFAWFWMDNLSWQNVETTEVPEPGSLAIIGLGLFGLGAMRRKTKHL